MTCAFCHNAPAAIRHGVEQHSREDNTLLVVFSVLDADRQPLPLCEQCAQQPLRDIAQCIEFLARQPRDPYDRYHKQLTEVLVMAHNAGHQFGAASPSGEAAR